MPKYTCGSRFKVQGFYFEPGTLNVERNIAHLPLRLVLFLSRLDRIGDKHEISEKCL